MRLLFVVQRYGHEVVGGAERACRDMATRLAVRGHEVETLTSCAKGYVDWANEYPEGEENIEGVRVHRLPVSRPREDRFFGPLNGRVRARKPIPFYLQNQWMRSQGPFLPGLVPWLQDRSNTFDVVVFFTYLYYTTWAGLPVASGLAPTILHPTAHDEPPLYMSLFSLMFRLPSAFVFLTEEESRLVHDRFHARQLCATLGLGADLDGAGNAATFRKSQALSDEPYLLFIGRLDPHKGSDELFDFFVAYKKRNPGPLRLVLLGDPVKPLPPHPDVVPVGFVDEQTKKDAIAGCTALVQPSYFESFSIVLVEAWAQGKPALVQGHCPVLDGQVRRAGGGIPYRGFAEFEAALNLMLEDGKLIKRMGAAGRDFVGRNYSWPTILDAYERFLARVGESRIHKTRIPSPGLSA